MTMHEKLTTEIFPEAVKNGSFGADVKKFLCFKTRDQNAGDHFSSAITFGDVTLEKVTGEHFVQPVVIKRSVSSCSLLEWYLLSDFKGLHYNEVLFFTRIVPLLQKYDKNNFLRTNIPEFVYGKATYGDNTEEDIIILKDLNQKGFKSTEDRLHLDEKHIKLALDKVATFHGLSLACQMDDPKGFNEVVSQIKEMVSPNVRGGSYFKKFSQIYNRCLMRGIKPLQKDPKYRDKLSNLLAYAESAETDDLVTIKYYEPLGPIPVIIHGDFSRNNLMFKYDTNGDPVDVVFFDFANVTFCSPAVDTSYLLSMNVSSEVRFSYWDDFLRTYYDSLSSQLDAHPKKPSFEDVELDLRQRGMYGYSLAAYAVPTAVAAINGEQLFTPSFDVRNLNKSHEEEALRNLQKHMQETGGREATEMLVDIVKHMLDKKYIF